MNKEWFSAAELADMKLPDLPQHRVSLRRLAEREGWLADDAEERRWRRRPGRGGGIEYHYTTLPPRAIAELVARQREPATSVDQKPPVSFSRYTRAPDSLKVTAEKRLNALLEIELLTPSLGRVKAIAHVAATLGISQSTIYNWQGLTAGTDRSAHVAALVPNYKGREAKAPFSDGAWQYFLDLYLQANRWTLEKCVEELRAKVKLEGWTIPSTASIRRRVDRDIPAPVLVLRREGEEAVERLYPTQRRDRSHFHALEWVNADGHKFDVFVRWPDGRVSRPLMVAFQDLYSNMVLSWRVSFSENKETVRLAVGDFVERYGIAKHVCLDNGRAFCSKWLTGGIKNRFRFKCRDEDVHGMLPLLGTQVHWTRPYSGRSKPIERSFGDFARDISRHPAFAGAWCGNSPDAKPEDFDPKKAVPLEEFLRVASEEIQKWNDREGRRTDVCAGKLSFSQAFSLSYEKSIITKATEDHRHLWLMAAEGLRVKRDATIELMGGQGRSPNRYHSHLLEAHAGQQVIVRFDPEWLERDINVYALDGSFLCKAPLLGKVAFDNADAAAAHARAYRAWLKAQKQEAEALTRVRQAELAAMLAPPPVPAAPPETKVVRPVFGNTALKPRPSAQEDAEAEAQFFEDLHANNRLLIEEARKRRPELALIMENGADD